MKQLFYNTLHFCINPPADGSVAEMLSANHRKEDEAMKLFVMTKQRYTDEGHLRANTVNYPAQIGMGWRSCDYCLATETVAKPLKVCGGCVCERYHAARYCRCV